MRVLVIFFQPLCQKIFLFSFYTERRRWEGLNFGIDADYTTFANGRAWYLWRYKYLSTKYDPGVFGGLVSAEH